MKGSLPRRAFTDGCHGTQTTPLRWTFVMGITWVIGLTRSVSTARRDALGAKLNVRHSSALENFWIFFPPQARTNLLARREWRHQRTSLHHLPLKSRSASSRLQSPPGLSPVRTLAGVLQWTADLAWREFLLRACSIHGPDISWTSHWPRRRLDDPLKGSDRYPFSASSACRTCLQHGRLNCCPTHLKQCWLFLILPFDQFSCVEHSEYLGHMLLDQPRSGGWV